MKPIYCVSAAPKAGTICEETLKMFAELEAEAESLSIKKNPDGSLRMTLYRTAADKAVQESEDCKLVATVARQAYDYMLYLGMNAAVVTIRGTDGVCTELDTETKSLYDRVANTCTAIA